MPRDEQGEEDGGDDDEVAGIREDVSEEGQSWRPLNTDDEEAMGEEDDVDEKEKH